MGREGVFGFGATNALFCFFDTQFAGSRFGRNWLAGLVCNDTLDGKNTLATDLSIISMHVI